MRPLIAASFIVAALLLGCESGHRQHDPRTISRTGAEGPIEGRPTLGFPHPIPGHATVLVPFAVESEKGLFEKSDPYRAGGIGEVARHRVASLSVGHGHGGSVRWHNAIVRDLQTGEEWPILGRRGIIGEWHMMVVQPEREAPAVSRAIVFVAVLDDTNTDGVLDDRDARVAIVADADGRNPRAVTPADAQVWNTFFDNDKDAIFFRIASDTNGDGKIDYDDIVLPYVLSVRGGAMAQRIISEETARRVEQILSP